MRKGLSGHKPALEESSRVSITDMFGESLAILLSERIAPRYADFAAEQFIADVKREVEGKRYTERVVVLAENLRKYLPQEYDKALRILLKIMGPENPHETGMFTNFYWLLPVGKFIELYGLDDFEFSIKAIEELTKRNTGEYAIRPFARKYPDQTIKVCARWARSDNFHLRRLACEGLRPKLPWATKLDVWALNPEPVFEILEVLKEDQVKFVKKSVANHVRDWVKVHPEAAQQLIDRWSTSANVHTQWIIKYAQR